MIVTTPFAFLPTSGSATAVDFLPESLCASTWYFSPAFSGLYLSGDDLSNTGTSYRYIQATTPAGAPAP